MGELPKVDAALAAFGTIDCDSAEGYPALHYGRILAQEVEALRTENDKLKAERKWSQDHHADICPLAGQIGALRKLLQEWRETPFFEHHGEWETWVQEYGGRVDNALADTQAAAPRKETKEE